jgi:hypothetical protein
VSVNTARCGARGCMWSKRFREQRLRHLESLRLRQGDRKGKELWR